MGYDAHITDTTTGETRVSRMDLDWHEASDFWWSEGNFACDCNRGTEFARASGENVDDLSDDEDATRFPCGHERFRVRITSEDGDVLYEDGPSKAGDD